MTELRLTDGTTAYAFGQPKRVMSAIRKGDAVIAAIGARPTSEFITFNFQHILYAAYYREG